MLFSGMGRKNRTSRSGLTLIEVVASLVLIAVAMPPMLMAMRDSAVRRASYGQQIVARWLIAEKLEEIIADRHSAQRGFNYVVNGVYPAETTVTGYSGFSRSVSITATGPDLVTAGAGYKVCTVTVGWKDAAAGNRTLAVSTVVTDYTP